MVNLDYLYNKESAKRFFNVNYFVDKKLSFRTIENGTILPHKDIVTGSWNWGGGGIIDDNGVFVKGSFVKSELNGIYTPPQMKFVINSKRSFTSGCFTPSGDIL